MFLYKDCSVTCCDNNKNVNVVNPRLRFRGLNYLNATLNYEFNATAMTFTIAGADGAAAAADLASSAKLCLTGADGERYILGPGAYVLQTAAVKFPLALGAC